MSHGTNDIEAGCGVNPVSGEGAFNVALFRINLDRTTVYTTNVIYPESMDL